MALATLSVVAASVVQTNDQRTVLYIGTLTVSAPTDIYPVGGFVLDSVLTAALQPTTNKPPLYVTVQGAQGGYIYQRIPSTGTLMVLQIPPNGSLTTAAPLQQYPSQQVSGIWADVLTFEARYLRNSS